MYKNGAQLIEFWRVCAFCLGREVLVLAQKSKIVGMYMISMRYKAMLLAGGASWLLAGCQILGTQDGIYWVGKNDNQYIVARECELLEEVVGQSGDDDAYLTIFLSNDNLRENARDDLEDKAIELGANTVQVTDNREYQKMLRTRLGLFKVEIVANAYQCGKG
ncbi:hypothetical protein A9Q99_02890 [Gammaproteobacteria bacterium 45_16_T64]|nr:hypothetical protein A9Q99_02890 [Gammaproteobacteria bacterium 45_16_T64]